MDLAQAVREVEERLQSCRYGLTADDLSKRIVIEISSLGAGIFLEDIGRGDINSSVNCFDIAHIARDLLMKKGTETTICEGIDSYALFNPHFYLKTRDNADLDFTPFYPTFVEGHSLSRQLDKEEIVKILSDRRLDLSFALPISAYCEGGSVVYSVLALYCVDKNTHLKNIVTGSYGPIIVGYEIQELNKKTPLRRDTYGITSGIMKNKTKINQLGNFKDIERLCIVIKKSGITKVLYEDDRPKFVFDELKSQSFEERFEKYLIKDKEKIFAFIKNVLSVDSDNVKVSYQ